MNLLKREWMVQALCRGLDSDCLSAGRNGWSYEKIRALESLCSGCPVRAECREYGHLTGDYKLMWFGELPPGVIVRKTRRENLEAA